MRFELKYANIPFGLGQNFRLKSDTSWLRLPYSLQSRPRKNFQIYDLFNKSRAISALGGRHFANKYRSCDQGQQVALWGRNHDMAGDCL